MHELFYILQVPQDALDRLAKACMVCCGALVICECVTVHDVQDRQTAAVLGNLASIVKKEVSCEKHVQI